MFASRNFFLALPCLISLCLFSVTGLLQSNLASVNNNNDDDTGRSILQPRNYYIRSNSNAGLERLAQILARRPKSSSSSAPVELATNNNASVAPPVNIALYYETLCPYCKAFINKQLYPLYKKLGSNIINVTFVPYGNAREFQEYGRYEYVCQHGIQECIGNNIHGCLLNSGMSAELMLPFIDCTESSIYYPSESVRRCGVSVGIDYAKLEKCAYDYHQYSQIMHNYATITSAAQPKLNGVPYVQIDGKYEPDATDNLLSFVCNAYKGSKPTACSAKAIERATVQQRVLVQARNSTSSLC